MITKGLSVHGWPSGHSLDCEEAVKFAQLHDVHCMINSLYQKRTRLTTTRRVGTSDSEAS